MNKDTTSPGSCKELSIISHAIQVIKNHPEIKGKFILASYGQDPSTGDAIGPKVCHFPIEMEMDALMGTVHNLNQEPHRNVYFPLCLMREDLPEGKKGGEADIVAVFGLVGDFDDKESHRWAERLPVNPSYALETSEGRFQAGYLFSAPLPVNVIKPYAELLQGFSKCDFGTKDVSHVWRIDKTLNWPNKKKVVGGRSPEPQTVKAVVDFQGYTDFEGFKAVLDAWKQSQTQKAADLPFQWDGDIDHLPIKAETKNLILSGAPEGQRSEAMQTVIDGLVYSNLSDGEIISIFNSYPIGAKYREQGNPEKWLEPQITKARGYVTKRATKVKAPSNNAPAPVAPVQEWQEVISLDSQKAECFNPDSFPGILGEMATAISRATETPFEMAAGLILAVVATTCQKKFVIEPKKGYHEPLNIWTIIPMEPGNRKSSTLTYCYEPLNFWERAQRIIIAEDIKRATVKRSLQESRLKSLKAKYGKAKSGHEAIEDEITEIETHLVGIPVSPQVWSQDITTEHLGTLMGLHGEKMSIFSAEGGIFDIIGGRYSNGVPNFDLYLQSFSGDSVRVDRGSREPVDLIAPCLSMGLCPQPEVLKGMVSKPGFSGRGLLDRPQYLIPESLLGYRTGDTEPVSEKVKAEYSQLIHRLLNIDQPTKEDGETPQPYILKLSPEAYQEWRVFSQVVEKGLREGGRFEFIKGYAGKLPGAAARVAGLLHCASNSFAPWEKAVSLDTMTKALDIADVFAGHALVAFDLMGADKNIELTRKVWTWIKRKKQDCFTKRDCFNSLKGSFPRVSDLEEPLEILFERNYIRSETKETGGRPSVMYTVNPSLIPSIMGEK